MLELLESCHGFQWDQGNNEKNWVKHGVTQGEIEEALFNRPLIIALGDQRRETTPRYYALGKSDSSRLLFLVFTIRDDLIRVISARPMSRRERRTYQDAEDAQADS